MQIYERRFVIPYHDLVTPWHLNVINRVVIVTFTVKKEMQISFFSDQVQSLKRSTKKDFSEFYSMAAMKVFWLITLLVVAEEAMARVFWETTDKATESKFVFTAACW